MTDRYNKIDVDLLEKFLKDNSEPYAIGELDFDKDDTGKFTNIGVLYGYQNFKGGLDAARAEQQEEIEALKKVLIKLSGLTEEVFEYCIDNPTYEGKWSDLQDEAEKSGVKL